MKEKHAARGRMQQHVRVLQALYIFSTVCSVLAVGLLVWVGVHSFTTSSGGDVTVHPGDEEAPPKDFVLCDFVRVLDGVCVVSEAEVNPLLTSVMIENHTESRPQSGLADASVVYEAPVEGQISRFLAIYPLGVEVDQVGPVRSARPYYLDWAREYGEPMYMHVGGSPQALSLIKQYGMYDRDEMVYGANNFWRSGNRYAPHNVYTSSELWQKAHDGRDWEAAPTYDGWQFGDMGLCFLEDEEKREYDCAEEIVASFNPPAYEAVWKYNKQSMKYERYQMGKLHKDADGEKIVADTVIVQRVETVVLDNEGRLGMTTVGEGEAIVFRDGYRIDGTWKKEGGTSRTEWVGVDGKNIRLKSGKIWVEVVNQHGAVEVDGGEEEGVIE